MVLLAGLKQMSGSALDFSSCVGIIGAALTIHNSTMMLATTFGLVTGVISMIVILLVVGVCGMETRCTGFCYWPGFRYHTAPWGVTLPLLPPSARLKMGFCNGRFLILTLKLLRPHRMHFKGKFSLYFIVNFRRLNARTKKYLCENRPLEISIFYRENLVQCTSRRM